MSCFKLKGTVIVHIWWQVILMTVYTAVIVVIHKCTDIDLNYGQSLTVVIGIVVGLLLGFRSNSAFNRYEEGRRTWSLMIKSLRMLVMDIWINVIGFEANNIVDKKSAINLCAAFAIATKHYLRQEYSRQEEDLQQYIPHIKSHFAPSSKASVSDTAGPASSLIVNVEVESKRRKTKVKKMSSFCLAWEEAVPTNIPLEIICYLKSYLAYLTANSMVGVPLGSSIGGSLVALTDNLTNFERIQRTPIPLAYSAHLSHSVWLFLLAIPFQFVGAMGWITIVLGALGSFCLLGILGIGTEIENPFGYDDNDLPLDDFCKAFEREVHILTGIPAPKADEWMNSDKNRPFAFASGCTKTSSELKEMSTKELENILRKNASALRISLKRKRKT